MGALFLKICGACLLAAFLALLLKKWNADAAVTVKLIAGAVLSAACVGALLPLIETVTLLGENEALSGYVGVLLRVLAVAVLTHITSARCRDCGEATLASYAELGGKIEILLLSLPLMREIVDMAMELLSMG